MEPEEINRAEKQALDLFLGGDSQTWQTPAETPEDFMARGLVDENGAATQRGELFLQLRDRGLIQPNGQFTERGLAYGMSLDDSLSPDNLWAYKVRSRDGVDASDATFGEMVGSVGEFVWDAAAGLGKRLSEEAKIGTKWENQDKLNLSGIGIAEGSIKATKELIGMSENAAAWVGLGMGDALGMEEEADAQMWKARQNLARTRKQNQDAKVGSLVEDIGIVSNATEMAAQAKLNLPPEEYAALKKQSEAFGQFLDPTILLPAGVAAKTGKVGIISRAGIKADATLAKVAAMDARIAAAGLEASAAEAASITSRNASQLATKLGNTLAGDRAITAQGIAARTAADAEKFTTAASTLAEEVSQLTAQRQTLATRIPENIAAITQSTIQAGQAARSIPVKTMGYALEKTGDGLIYLNEGLKELAEKSGVGAAYTAIRRAAPIGGFAVGGFPGVAAVEGALASGTAVRNYGRFSQIVGKELSKARGQVPFWQRVGNNANLSPVHRGIARLMDTASMGNALPNAVRSGAKGIFAAYPIDLAFEFLAEGGDPNADTFKRAFAQSLVIGGSSAMLGGMFAGTKERHKQLALGDELNFRQDLTPDQKPLFEMLPVGVKRAVATYAASHPQLKFEFTDGVNSSFNSTTNTATIGLKSTNPMRALIAHEVLHHTIIRNQMEDSITALLLGDMESGGILRSNDGKLSADFQNFWDEYNRRRTNAGESTVGIKEAALEYYIEASADHVAGIAESGELGSMTGRTSLGRIIRAFTAATVAKVPIIKDLHFNSGGLVEPNGVMVMGNGLLANGIYENPQIKAMTRQMLATSAGRSQGNFKVTGRDSEGGIVLPTPDKNDPLVDKMIAAYETEEVNGQTRVKRDKEGNPIPVSKPLLDARANLGNVIKEALEAERKESNRGNALPDDAKLDATDDGSIVLNGMSDKTLAYIRKKGILNSEQMRILREINRAVREFDGSNYFFINHPATDFRKKYKPISATLRDAVPLDIRITKQGNLLVSLMSVTKLKENIDTRINTKRGKELYQGDAEALKTDLGAMMEHHNKGDGLSESYFKTKYMGRWMSYMDFCNSVFGLMTPSQKTGVSKDGTTWRANPLFELDKVGYKDNVFRTYRIDRISQATKATGSESVKMPFIYGSVKMNLMPNGIPENP